MNPYHDRGLSRRDLMKLGAASAAACASGALPFAASGAHAASPTARRGTRFVLDCHVHVGGSPALASLIDQVHTPKDWVGFGIVDGAHPSEEEREWIAWRTADAVYQLGLAV